MESKLEKPNCDENKSVKVLKGATDLQRLKLEKLMKNPNKEAFIPEKSKEKEPRAPHEFIRNVWGSSAGAGSGDFHVYRGVRRREYARQKFINEKAERMEKDAEFHKKVEENQKAADERTAKKRAKRNKKKQRQKAKKSRATGEKEENKSEEEDEDSDEEEDGKKEEEDGGSKESDKQLTGSKDINGEDKDFTNGEDNR
ncbi:PRKR-interacting protein 1 homolog [Saccostrea echinata]|uniref:PRKR-interacting protein 1 homolog n=1 Tax=Saccostrea echinata TaxID=191078 RepID=UPI002A7F958F|nr:PRKR-interacting protein 1 homolog [Saccostrea echinata]